MAQQVTAYIYGQDGNDWGKANGLSLGFPTQSVLFFPLNPAVTLGSATTHTKIKVLNNGNNFLKCPEFYTDKTVATLITESNA